MSSLDNAIKEEILKENYIPFFQPILGKNEIVYECLARMVVNNKIILPENFIFIAKEMQNYQKLTQTMIEKSFKYFANKEISFSINLDYEDICNNETIAFLKKNIAKNEIGKYLIIEILEHEIIDFKLVQDFIDDIKVFGVRIALDDFGSSYSNLGHLIYFSPDIVKIDAFFIKNILTNKKFAIIVKKVILLAKELGIKIVTEYVESKEIYDYLKTLEIDYFQGYYFGKPNSIILNQNNKLLDKKLQRIVS